ncbi:MAG TPA: 3-oxosteroid 1-dehydrogenase [Nocardioidaceae bacterium]|nr:3-oxosteroid 1-dehydrogenase [Nocardioidaceae bacterium]
MTDYDVVVVGSGAAGLTAALTAARRGMRAVVVEKAPCFGGSTARSGGGVWIPNNHVLAREHAGDTPADGRAYVAHLVDGVVEPERQQAFLTHGPPMLEMVCQSTPLRLKWVRGYSDYYPEAPGGRPKGRSVEPRPLDARVLGDEIAHLEPPYLAAPAGMTVTQADYKWLNLSARHPRGVWRALRVGARTATNRLRRRRMLSMGQALVAALRAGLARLDVPVLLDTPMLELVVDGDRVTGVRVQHEGTETVLTARRAVLLATGGFEHNEAMRKEYQEHPIGTEWTVGAVANTGDGITAAQALGADVDLMDDAWWGPSIPLTGGPYFCLSERALPGCIMVNAAGARFVNESSPYVDAVKAMYAGPRTGVDHIPCWLVADQRYRNNYTFAGLGPRQPFPRRWYAAGVVQRADTVEELAERIGVPAHGLRQTVTRFNDYADSGVDADFGRGRSRYDHYYGDPRRRQNPNLAPLEKAPFYAVRIVPGDLGTKGGLRTDARARVLRADGSAIPGLYAAGNASATVMGHTYAGPGATLGPAMTFGYLAAQTAADCADADAAPQSSVRHDTAPHGGTP